MSPDEIVAFLNSIENAIEFQIDELKATLLMVQDERKRFMMPAVISSIGKRLEVPWLSQIGSGANYALGDCGTADVAMILRYLGKDVTVDEVSIATGKPRSFKLLEYTDIIAAAEHWSVRLEHQLNASLDTLCADIDAGKPVIVLVDYKSIPAISRFDSTYAAGHFILLVGYDAQTMVYHDSYFTDRQGGAYRTMARAEFERAYSTVAGANKNARHSLRLT